MSDTSERIILNLDVPVGTSLHEAVSAIADDMEEQDDESGYARTTNGDVAWRVRRPEDGVAVDPRQRRAAALLITAYDMPQDVMRTCASMLEAADIQVGMTIGQMHAGQRRANLVEARRLIDEMLGEV
jgi:hypothetical protein